MAIQSSQIDKPAMIESLDKLSNKLKVERKIEIVFTLISVVIDALMVGLAFYTAYKLRLLIPIPPAVNIMPFHHYIGMMVIYIVTILFVFALRGLYHLKRGTALFDESTKVVSAVFAGLISAVALTALIFKNELDYPRLMLAYAWVLTIVFVIMGRLIHATIEANMRARGWGNYRVIIVGASRVGQMIAHTMMDNPRLGYQPVGYLDDEVVVREIGALDVLGKTGDLATTIEKYQADEVVIALPEATHKEILALISQCKRDRVSIKVFPDVFQIITSEVSINDLGGMPLLGVRDVALRGWYRLLKRGMDLAMSTVGLIFTSPFMLLTAIMIRLDSPGAVFYCQERMGLDAKPFQMIKFRSMREDAEESGPGWTVEDDPRRTKLGTWMREHNIDELPQLINVFWGEMSLVGPRPERPVYVEQFKKMIPRYMDRHLEKAGMTGWAQINGLRGDTSIAERTKYDLWYVENWSLYLDLKILVRTALMFLWGRSKNAY